MFKGYSLRKSAEIVGVTWVTLFYWRHKLLSALKQMDIEQSLKLTRPISYILKRDSVVLLTVNHESVEGNLNIEVLATNKFVFLLPETELKQLSLKLLVWGVL